MSAIRSRRSPGGRSKSTGHRRGQINIYDDFKEDERFAQLLRNKLRGDDEMHLIFNGDIFDLLKVPVKGTFSETIGERLAMIKLYRCLRGHPVFVKAIAKFLENENAVVHFQPGNHDMEFIFPGVQQMFCRAVSGENEHPRVRFHSVAPFWELDGVQFHHGHQFEALHAVDFNRLLIPRLNREVNVALNFPDVKKRLLDLNLVAHSGSPEQAAELLAFEIKRWGDVISRAKIQKQ